MSDNKKLIGTLNEILDSNSNFKLLKKKNISNKSLVQNLNFNLKNYGKTWIVLIDNNLSKNYYEKFNYYNCCFTGQKYRKRANFQLEWSANCLFFIKCPNPECNNWIKYEWKRKKTFLENINLINNYPNCCEICNKNENYKNPGLCCICNTFNFNRDSVYRGKDSYLNIANIKTGCNCSQNWFIRHNSSKEMIEISKQNIKYALKWKEEYPEEALLISQNNIKYAHKALDDLWKNNPEWSENQRKIQAENIKIAMAKQIWLWKNDPEWAENMRQILINNAKK